MHTDDFIGQRLGNFLLLETIGSGGMGTVYKARQVGLDRTAAVKILRPDLVMQNRDFVRRFLREAKTSALLSHPNVVQVYTVGAREGVYYLAMEFVEGESVGDKLDKRGVLSEREALLLAIQAARGLKAAAEKGLVHRDIKPDNLLVTPGGTVKVADFGLAKLGTMQSRLTREGVTIGTIAYMSPEQVRGEELDSRSDIYSLGATLYHILSGRPPFEGESAVTVAYKHINDAPVPLRKLNPVLSAGIEAVVSRMLAKDPADRHASMDELLSDLEAVLSQGHPASTNTTAFVELGLRPRDRSGPPPFRTAALGAGAVLLAAVVALLAWAGSGGGGAAAPPPRPEVLAHVLVLAAPAEGAWVRSRQMDVAGAVGADAVEVTVNGTAAELEDGRFRARLWLAEGDDRLVVRARFPDGEALEVARALRVDAEPPRVVVEEPPEQPWHTREDRVRLRGRVDEAHPAALTVGGARVPGDATAFDVTATLPSDGEHRVTVEAADEAGNVGRAEVVLVRDRTPPSLRLLDFPGDGRVESDRPVFRLRFRSSERLRSVRVNGRALEARGFLFETDLPLAEGANELRIEAEDLAGNRAELRAELAYRRAAPAPAEPSAKTFDRVLSRLDRTPGLEDKIRILEAFLAEGPPEAVRRDAGEMLGALRERLRTREDRRSCEEALAGAAKEADPFAKMAHLYGYLDRFPEGRFTVRVGEELERVRREGLPAGVVRSRTRGEYVNERDDAVMVLVPEGPFLMGSRPSDLAPYLSRRPDLDMEIYENELPRHRVHLSAYFIYKHEVCNEQFARFLAEHGSLYSEEHKQMVFDSPAGLRIEGGTARPARGMERFPAVEVTFYGAEAYARWAGAALPTEAQWEKAARWDPASGRERAFPWGDAYRHDAANVADHWYGRPIESQKDWLSFRRMRLDGIHAKSVDSMPQGASAVGCHHMAGNVWEWCLDWYDESFYGQPQARERDPVNSRKSYVRVLRGGSFGRAHVDCRCAKRSRWGETRHSDAVGFRCVRRR